VGHPGEQALPRRTKKAAISVAVILAALHAGAKHLSARR
jgi:hypothetical protein